MRLIKVAHFLSLDVVTGALLFQSFLSLALFKTYPSTSEILVLGSSIWSIYLVDRLIDNLKIGNRDLLHDFYFKNTKGIKLLILFNLVLCLLTLPYLSYRLFLVGILIGVFIFFYWILWYLRFFDSCYGLKEFFTALFYGIGIGCFAITSNEVNIFNWFFLSFGIFLLAFQNLILFTGFNLGRIKDRLLSTVEWTLLLFILFLGYYFGQLILVLPFLSTFGIHIGLHYFSNQKPKRWIGELAFLSPIIYLAHEIFSA